MRFVDRTAAADAEQQLDKLILDGSQPAIARGSALLLLGPYASPASRSAVTAAIADPDPLVRTVFRLRHDLIMIGRRSLEIGTASAENPAYYEQVTRVAIMHITALQDLPSQAPQTGNGQH